MRNLRIKRVVYLLSFQVRYQTGAAFALSVENSISHKAGIKLEL